MDQVWNLIRPAAFTGRLCTVDLDDVDPGTPSGFHAPPTDAPNRTNTSLLMNARAATSPNGRFLQCIPSGFMTIPTTCDRQISRFAATGTHPLRERRRAEARTVTVESTSGLLPERSSILRNARTLALSNRTSGARDMSYFADVRIHRSISATQLITTGRTLMRAS
ncbi:hypothetical protein [Burkholderia sp. LA-2-3-30-S1-D2]|uniref:hypothetical protein n=1 Tax=Burkholderia sp. LA-2-3-30-S1-D2 TaxID=1637862 RepID=UPI00131EE314|nr:hypothetical protein [Burkholderia sp. LA-2-3-30-S1-D2]